MKQGRCSNFGNCSIADNGQIIEVDDFDDFVCPECGHDLQVSLQPVVASNKKTAKAPKPSGDKKTGNNKMLFIIGGAVVALAIVGGIVFALIGSKEKQRVVESTVTERTTDDDLDMYEDEDLNSDHPFDYRDEDPGHTEVQEPEELSEKPVVSDEYVGVITEDPKPAETAPTPTPKEPSSHRLSYGTWSGGMKNGKPHGAGTMTYSTSCVIDARDSKGRVAEPGEYVVGEWDNGNLIQGRWFKNDGSKEAIIIGKAG